MASNADDSSVDESASSLGESTYDFIDERSINTDDDEASNLTRSICSTDMDGNEEKSSTADGVESLQESCETSRGSQDRAVTTEEYASNHSSASDFSEDEFRSDIELDEQIEEEPSDSRITMTPRTSGTCTLGHYSSTSLPQSCLDAFRHGVEPHRPNEVTARLQMGMAPNTIVRKRSYKVLYAGNTTVKETVLQKLGSILAFGLGGHGASSIDEESPRFNVVPISSFGGVQTQDVMLVGSMGLEMAVDDCIAARHHEGSIFLTLSTGKAISRDWSETSGKYLITSDGHIPDLAIVVLPGEGDSPVRAICDWVCRFMISSQIPCVMISEQPWTSSIRNARTSPIYRMPHICLESSSNGSSMGRTRRVPIDLQQFLKLHASQLNRNLAYQHACMSLQLKPANPHRKQTTLQRITPVSSSLAKLKVLDDDTPTLYIQRNFGLLRTFVLLELLACAALVWLVYSIQAGEGSQHMTPPHVLNMAQSTPSGNPAHIYSETSPISSALSRVANSTPMPEVKSLSPSSTDLAALLLDPSTLRPNASVKFLVHVVGDRHIVVRPPQWFTQRRQSPKVSFQVTRRELPIEHEVSTLFEGMYSVRIPRKEAYGKMNISVWTTLKPKVREHFEVDFGNPWLRIDGVRRAADTIKGTIGKDLTVFQNGLSAVYTSTSTELQEFVQDVSTTAGRLSQGIRQLQSVALNRTVQTKDLLTRQSRSLTLAVARGVGRPAGRVRKALAAMEGGRRKQNAVAWAAVSKTFQTASQILQSREYFSARSMVLRLQDIKQVHLRNTQKHLLKVWWKAIGTQRPKKQRSSCTKRRGFASPKKMRCP